ncbi:CYTH domain-containing protein [Paracoccus aestuariivivens]|uniref:CYTH domain-containing protein n=1 Tax=Paracoccus aestuariivivens TaxID=1820333 RepID=UPI001478970D|nr:CYTH domain-containing protein [Paracoccus aestuariivivens]
MAKEIERKFLVANSGWQAGVSHQQELHDGLISTTEGRKVRVRIQDDQAILTVKGPRHGIVRDEFEYPVPLADAQEMLRLCGDEVVEKTRYHIPAGELTWTVDVYHGLLAGITIAEVELPSLNYPVPLPAWVGREVSGVQAYRKVNMVAARKANRELEMA